MNIDQIKPFFFTAADAIRGAEEELDVPEVMKRLTFCLLDLGDGRVAIGKNHGHPDDRHFSSEIGRHFARKHAIKSAEWLIEQDHQR